jgi:uncharacterized protein (TIGR02246 family)
MPATDPASLADDPAAAKVPQRIVAAWAANDADAFADVFADDGIMILPNVYLEGNDQVRSFMARAYQGDYRGTSVTGEPLAIRRLSDTSAIVVTAGGVLLPGETEVAAERAIRATWVLTKQRSEWLIASYHNSPVTD